jgi:hypothetical protein
VSSADARGIPVPRVALAILVTLAGCRQLFDLEPPDRVADAGIVDAPDARGDASTITGCWPKWLDGTVRFDPPTQIVISNPGIYDRDPYVTADERTMYFSSSRGGGMGSLDIWVATRPTPMTSFSPPTNVAALNESQADIRVTLTGDGMTLFMSSNRSLGMGSVDIWMSTLMVVSQIWSAPQSAGLDDVNDADAQHDPWISDDGLRLYLAPLVGSSQSIVVASRSMTAASFGFPGPVPGLDAMVGNKADPALSPDERVILFTIAGSGPGPTSDIYYATRSGASLAFATPLLVPDINSVDIDGDPMPSRDGCRLYFASERGGDFDIYVAAVR